jgi:hypothetical protein
MTTPTKPNEDRTAQELAIIRAELGLLEEGVGNLGEDGTVFEEARAYLKAYVYGGLLDKLVYYLVLAGATVVALVSIIGAIMNMSKYTKSSEVAVVDQLNSLKIPEIRYCTEFYNPSWTVEAVCALDHTPSGEQGYDCFSPEYHLKERDLPPDDGVFEKDYPEETVELSLGENDGKASGLTYEGSLNAMAGKNLKTMPTTLTREVEIHENMYTERYCLVQPPWHPSSTEHNFYTQMLFQLKCNARSTSCSLDTDSKGFPTNHDLQSPMFIGSIYVDDGPQHYVDLVSGDNVVTSLTKSQVEFTDKDGSKSKQVDYTPTFMTVSNQYAPFQWFFGHGFVPAYKDVEGNYGGDEVRMTRKIGFFSKMATSKVTVSSTVMVPMGDFGSFYAALGGAASTVALILGLCFGKFDVPKKDKKTGKSIDAYIGRWRRGPTQKAREEKTAAISKISEEHYGLMFTW